MEFLKRNLDKIGFFFLSAYVILLLFAIADERLGWEILVDYF